MSVSHKTFLAFLDNSYFNDEAKKAKGMSSVLHSNKNGEWLAKA